MALTRSSLIRLLRIGALILVAAVIIAYAAWRSLAYARGPHITIFEPIDGSSVASTTVTIVGRAERVNSLSLNGQPISVDESGGFSETLIIFPGSNILSFEASDQFGRSTVTELRLVGTVDLPKPSEGSPGNATTTASSSSASGQ